MHEIVQRGNELAVKAATGTLTDEDRAMVDAEIQQLKSALNEAAHNTVFNEIRLFPEQGASPKTVEESSLHYEVKYQIQDGTFAVTTQINPTDGSTVDSGAAGQVLADKIANEFVPNAIQQILNTFSSLKSAVGSDSIDMALDISYLDGPSNTLAYAQCSFYGTGKPFSFLIKVDSSDFSDEDALGTGANAEMLESTIAHELMHSVMQYTMTDGMTGRAGEEFPNWFVEGTAQLSGGGFTTGWNNTLTYLTSQLTYADNTSYDSQIADYLNNYTVAGRPYGHGYLATAYLGYLANGGGEVTSDNIAKGMDLIFSDILNGSSFSTAIYNLTGLTESDIENMFANGDSALVEFVRKLSYATKSGAGSVITSSLDVGGTSILGNTASVQQFAINPDKVNVDMGSGQSLLYLQVGTEKDARIEIKLYQMDANALGLKNTNVKTQSAAGDAINDFKAAIHSISVSARYSSVVTP